MNLRDYWQIPYVLERVIKINEKSPINRILDYGCGSGKYAMLLKDYLGPRVSGPVIDGIDVTGRHLVMPALYDNLQIGEPPHELGRDWDLVLLLDVIEHMEKEHAHELIEQLLGVTKWLLITTPLGFRKQYVAGQPAMTHRSGWWSKDFRRYGRAARWSTHPSWRTRWLRLPRHWQLMVTLRGDMLL